MISRHLKTREITTAHNPIQKEKIVDLTEIIVVFSSSMFCSKMIVDIGLALDIRSSTNIYSTTLKTGFLDHNL